MYGRGSNQLQSHYEEVYEHPNMTTICCHPHPHISLNLGEWSVKIGYCLVIVSVFENKLDRDQVYYLVSSKTVAWGSQTVLIVVSWYNGKNGQKPLYLLARTIQNHGFLWIYNHVIQPFMIIFGYEIHLFHQEYPILIVIIHFVLVITCYDTLTCS